MKILFLGDIVGDSGLEAVKKFLPIKIKEKKIDFVIANGENAAKEGVGITEEITNNLFRWGVDVITTGNHVWDQKETVKHIEKEKRLLRPENDSTISRKRFWYLHYKERFKNWCIKLNGKYFYEKM